MKRNEAVNKVITLLKLTEKQEIILKLLLNYEVLTVDTLSMVEPHRSNRHKLLKSLEERHLITKYSLSKKDNYWFFTDYFKSILKVTQVDTNPSICEELINEFIQSANINHTQKIAQTELIVKNETLLDSSTNSFLCEKEVENYFKNNREIVTTYGAGFVRIPDAMFIHKGYQTAVEIELHPKSSKRYFKIFHFYRDYYPYKRIYWICNKKTLKTIYPIFLKLMYDNLEELIDSSEETHKQILRVKNLHCFIEIDEFIKKGFSAKQLSLDSK